MGVPPKLGRRILSLLRDMRDSHHAFQEEGNTATFHLEALEFAGDATDIMEELDAMEGADDAAAVGFQIQELLVEMLERLPRTAYEWSDHRQEVTSLERIHYELMQIRNQLDNNMILKVA